MELKGSIAVVTGGASGIGRALCHRFAAEGAQGIVVSDINEAGAAAVAAEVKGLAVPCDVGDERQVAELVRRAEEAFDRIDLFCSNAGIATKGGSEASDADWQRNWQVNLMSHVYAARAVLPGMLKRGRGYLLNTASAAGLLTEMGSAPYSVTKHAAVAFAELLSIHHRDAGIGVSCLCPMGVTTEMLQAEDPHVAYLRSDRRDPGACRRRGHRGASGGAISDPASSGSQRVLRISRNEYRPLAGRHAKAQQKDRLTVLTIGHSWKSHRQEHPTIQSLEYDLPHLNRGEFEKD